MAFPRIAAPVWNATEARYENLATLLEAPFARDSVSFFRRYNLPFVQGDSADDYCAALRKLFRYTPPTCLLVKDVSHYLTASSFFLSRKLVIPADISVILLSHDPELKYILPTPAHFIRYSDGMVLQVFNALKEQMLGLQSHEEVELIPIWIPRDSLADPKSR